MGAPTAGKKCRLYIAVEGWNGTYRRTWIAKVAKVAKEDKVL